MKLTHVDDGSVTVVSASGRLTIGNELSRLRDLIRELIADGRRAVVVNLEEVSFVDSAGLGQLMAARRALANAEGKFALAGAQGRPRDLIQVTRIDSMIDVFEDVEAAKASLANSNPAVP